MIFLFRKRCKFEQQCTPYKTYTKINKNTQLALTGLCLKNCENINSLTYKYNIYKSWSISPTDIQEKWYLYSNSSYFTGINNYKKFKWNC
jgi:hypothetical protein